VFKKADFLKKSADSGLRFYGLDVDGANFYPNNELP